MRSTESDAVPVRARAEVASLGAYRQGSPAPDGAFKLSSNENPFPPLGSVLDAMQAVSDVNRYPDARADELRDRLATHFGVARDELHVGAGSASLLAQFFGAVTDGTANIITAAPSFEAYPGMVTVAGGVLREVPLDRQARHDLPAMADAIDDHTRAVVICSPNNPTGPVVTRQEFERFIERIPGDVLVLLDEAYLEFVSDPAAVDGVEVYRAGHPNVVSVRTFSKAWGLAGLRIGYAVGAPRVLDLARSTAIPLSVTGVAVAAAMASLDEEEEIFGRVALIIERRERLVEGLRERGLSVPQAQGNFVWIPTGEGAGALATALSAEGLVVRSIRGGIRITVGEEATVERILRAAERPQ